ncbi:MAG: sulfate ABC transporter substrate-binding protein [Bacilli bacterium]
MNRKFIWFSVFFVAFISVFVFNFTNREGKEMLIVSFEPTRAMFREINERWSEDWKTRTGERVTVLASHGGSGKQARSVLQGLEADVVSLGLAFDVDRLAKEKLLNKDWATIYPNQSVPFYSTIVFLVRKDNPKGIRDWADLVRSDVSVIMPDPKTSGGARWNYIAAYAYAKKHYQSEQQQLNFMKKLYHNVPVLDSGARASTTTFAERELGDVLVTWEAEALMAQDTLKEKGFELIVPSVTVQAETPVAVVDRVVKEHGTERMAEDWVKQLYTVESQRIIAKYYFRPTNAQVVAETATTFPELAETVVKVEMFGGWKKVQEEHFQDGGVFDSILKR